MPAFVTAIGLVFAVLLERIRFSVAFKVVVFMPMAISLFAAGVIWRLMYEKDPDQGTINAAIAVVKDAVSPSGALSAARPSTETLEGAPEGGLVLEKPLEPGGVAQLGLTAIRASEVPERRRAGSRARGARRAGSPASCGETSSRAAARPASVEEGELGLPGVTVQLRDESGASVETTTETDGTFAFERRRGRHLSRRDRAGARSRSRSPGVSWLGAT